MFTEKINDLFSQQLSEWELAKTNYEQLKSVKTKRIGFGSFDVLVQFNPERIRSSAAKVDSKSVEARPCFLCKANRPAQQRDLPFNRSYTILVNPFPIFRRHLTITRNEHTEQRIRNSFPDMLTLARELDGFSVFYNGPQCGASAPDHLHFQAGERGFMLLEKDFQEGVHVQRFAVISGTEIWQWKGYLRGIITLKGTNTKEITGIFDRIYTGMAEIQTGKPEPMLNIIAYSENSEWTIHILPRRLHRPAQFFKEGDEKLLVSPASVDLGGVIITPREEDFNHLDKEKVTDIFTQVCFDENELIELVRRYI